MLIKKIKNINSITEITRLLYYDITILRDNEMKRFKSIYEFTIINLK